jgi:hypothetical protein
MSACKTMTGTYAGRLYVLGRNGNDATGKAVWKCLCECGRIVRAAGGDLRRRQQSCGCVRVEKLLSRTRTHGECRSPEYRSWRAMLSRCNRPSCSKYKYYGGRGIKVCERWGSFSRFMEDMGPRPAGASIDRVDPNGDYTPVNCRWADHHQQQNNRRNNVLLEWRGSVKTLAEWERATGIKQNTIRARVINGWSVERALTEATRAKG